VRNSLISVIDVTNTPLKLVPLGHSWLIRGLILFTDGAVASGDGSASVRGVLRDQHGN
ncbi:hypothetical protein Goarm_007218, partial [Gossypium armourianum]|nr:hypothetical protein [Gossypium armourianum]